MAKFQSSARKDRGFAFPALKLGFLCDILRAENYILLQETNKINRKFFQILNDFLNPLFCKQGFRDTKAIFCLLGKLPNPHKTLPAASGCASVPDALTAVPAKEKKPVQHEHYTHTAPDIPSSTALSISLETVPIDFWPTWPEVKSPRSP